MTDTVRPPKLCQKMRQIRALTTCLFTRNGRISIGQYTHLHTPNNARATEKFNKTARSRPFPPQITQRRLTEARLQRIKPSIELSNSQSRIQARIITTLHYVKLCECETVKWMRLALRTVGNWYTETQEQMESTWNRKCDKMAKRTRVKRLKW